MQEFLLSNKVSFNLMSLTGYRTLVVLEALLESPKTNDEINACLLKNQYIKEKFSADTLRLYLNSLRAIGCEITQASKMHNNRYTLLSHPFSYDIPKAQLKALQKLYKSICDKIELKELIKIEKVLEKISQNVNNEATRNFLHKIMLLKKIDIALIEKLIMHCDDKNQIIFSYNSPKSGEKNIEIIADKLTFKSEKLYLWGENLTHNEYSFFPVERIKNICAIRLAKSQNITQKLKITYEVNFDGFDLEPNEKIIAQNENKLVIEAYAQNEFEILQRILFMGNNCKLLEPEFLREKLLTKLKTMEKNYDKN